VILNEELSQKENNPTIRDIEKWGNHANPSKEGGLSRTLNKKKNLGFQAEKR